MIFFICKSSPLQKKKTKKKPTTNKNKNKILESRKTITKNREWNGGFQRLEEWEKLFKGPYL